MEEEPSAEQRATGGHFGTAAGNNSSVSAEKPVQWVGRTNRMGKVGQEEMGKGGSW